MTKLRLILGVMVGLALNQICFGQGYINTSRWGPLDWVKAHEHYGKFKEAATVLTNALNNKSLNEANRKQLEFELDRLDRIRKDYRLTKDALFNELKASVKDLTAGEFEKWIAEG